MTSASQQVLERIVRLSEQFSPEEQEAATERLAQLADQLERERAWNALLATRNLMPICPRGSAK